MNSFHNYAVKTLPNNFKLIAKHSDNTIEAAVNTKISLLCLMFHPERPNISQKQIDQIVISHLDMKFLLLAAGRSSRIYKKINKPKCLININGESLITKIIKNINDIGNYQINIVVGFKSKEIKKELKNFQNIKYINNKFYKTRDMTHSFITALKKINDDLIVTYTDILFDKKILKIILKNKKKEILLPILKNWKDVWKRRKKLF